MAVGAVVVVVAAQVLTCPASWLGHLETAVAGCVANQVLAAAVAVAEEAAVRSPVETAAAAGLAAAVDASEAAGVQMAAVGVASEAAGAAVVMAVPEETVC